MTIGVPKITKQNPSFNMKYKTIYLDPPWNLGGGGKIKRGVDKHYPLMETQAIFDMKPFIEELSDTQCHMYMWVTNNFLKSGLEIMKYWDFKYITNIVWVKNSFGTGQYFRGQHEILLFGRKGPAMPYKHEKNIPSIVFSDKQEHSKKPKEFYRIIEKVSYPPYIELFARNRREGWDNWGNEIKPEDPKPKRLF
jgi:N6-adenosine-specific RNA methylase IME4